MGLNHNKPSAMTLSQYTEGQQRGNGMTMGVLLGQCWQGYYDQMSFTSTLLEPSITGLDAMKWKEGNVYEHLVRPASENIAVHLYKNVAANTQTFASSLCFIFF